VRHVSARAADPVHRRERYRLTGAIERSGNRNAALPVIAAALLTEHPVTLHDVPRISGTECWSN
jgi:UDP-N-acetylglucosamine enolpyruvyl transferase